MSKGLMGFFFKLQAGRMEDQVLDTNKAEIDAKVQ